MYTHKHICTHANTHEQTYKRHTWMDTDTKMHIHKKQAYVHI